MSNICAGISIIGVDELFLGIEISETFLIAVITFLSGLSGAVIGLIGLLVSSKRAATAQIQQALAKEMFLARKSAYDAVFAAETEIVSAGQDIEAVAKAVADFNVAVSSAAVVASFDTTILLNEFSEQRKAELKGSKVKDHRSALLASMQKDLSSFTAPVIVRNQWFRRLCGKPAKTAAKRVARLRRRQQLRLGA